MPTVQFLGGDLSTTALSLGVRSAEGKEDFVSVPNRGATRWNGEPGFWLELLPELFAEGLDQLGKQGWSFVPGGVISLSVRQHDMVLLDQAGEPLLPSLSWQSNAAREEVEHLRRSGAETSVGRIEPRFILPKLMWALGQAPGLDEVVHTVLTTGDYIAWCLTGQLRLSTSDGVSNALLDQKTKQLSLNVFRSQKLPDHWFPEPVASGTPVGMINDLNHGPWANIRRKLRGYWLSAGLGDNHAGGVGCGLGDSETVVISAGSSGTVVRMVSPETELQGNAACFEYYDHRLLLTMLADCAVWYNRFLDQFAPKPIEHALFSQQASETFPTDWIKLDPMTESSPVPADLGQLAWPIQVASTQFSIAIELLKKVRLILAEPKNAKPIKRFLLTGGLAQAPVLQRTIEAGLRALVPGAQLMSSARTDKLAFQSATYGAVINAALEGDPSRLSVIVSTWCPSQPIRTAPDSALDSRVNELIAKS